MRPDFEVVSIGREQSFRAWEHGYPFATVRWHFHPEYEIHQVVATSGRFFVGDFIGTFEPGNLVMTGPNLPHNWVSDLDAGMEIPLRNRVCQFSQDFVTAASKTLPELQSCRDMLDRSRNGILFSPRAEEATLPIFKELVHATGIRRLEHFFALLAVLAADADAQPLTSGRYEPDPSLFMAAGMNEVLRHIGDNLAEAFSEPELARIAGMNPSAFSRSFRRHTGIPLVRYVNRLRINLACQLLVSEEQMSVTDVCFASGFRNLSNFNRRSLAEKGVSPTRFRALMEETVSPWRNLGRRRTALQIESVSGERSPRCGQQGEKNMKISKTALAAAFAIFAGTASAQTVAFLMPDQGSTRYDEHDYPGFQAELKTVCPDCTPIYQNANGDVALQQQQVNSAIAQGAKVIVLDPVDSGAAASLVQLAQSQDVKVIAYDRPIPGRPADFYISFDNEAIGKAIAESLVQHLQAEGVTAENGGVLLINGSPTDAAARLIRDGARAGIETGPYEMLAEYDTPNWEPPQAQQWAAGQITRFGDRIVGVVAANDGTAGGAVAAFKAAGVDPLPPVTGNDATTAALQLIIAGDQYNTISKPSEIVGAAAARVAAQFLKGETPEAKATLYDTPSELFVPAIVTRDTLKAEIVDKGIASAADLCTGRYAEGCAELGIN